MKTDSQEYMVNLQIDFKSSEETEMYHYLFMRFYQLYSHSHSHSHIDYHEQKPPQLISQLYNSAYCTSILDLCLQNQLNISMSFQADQWNDVKNQAKRIIFAQILAKDYSCIFLNPQNSNLSIEGVIFKTITQQSIISIVDSISTYPNLNHMNNQISQINDEMFQLIGSQIGFLILSIAIHNKINIKRTPFQEIYNKLKDILDKILLSINLDNNTKNRVFYVLNQYLWEAFNQQNFTQQQRISQSFTIQFQRFKIKYQTSETVINRLRNILSLHYVIQHLEASKKQQSFDLNYRTNSFDNYPLNSMINFFNCFQTQNKSITQINRRLLQSFVKQPYQTSVFVLFKLLSDCGIRNIDKIFTKNPADQMDCLLVNPLTFLLVDPKLITRSNAQSFSLSLWIIMSVWQKNKDYQGFDKKQRQKTVQSNNKTNQGSSGQKSMDPRQIFRIKKDSYSIPDSQNNSKKAPQQEGQKQITKKTLEPSKIINYANQISNYENELMTTLMIFLLSLEVETTMLKYYPIEFSIISQMARVELLPSLLLNSPFAMKTVGNSLELPVPTQQSKNFYLTDEQLLQKIEKAETVEEIDHLQQLINKKKSANQQKNHNPLKQQSQTSIFQSEYNQWLLPWMSLIQDRFIYSLMRNSIQSLQLAGKLAQRRPNTFLKVYSYDFIGQISGFTQRQMSKIKGKKNQRAENLYKFKGNRNAPMKKSIDYGKYQRKKSQDKAQNVIRQNLSRQQRIQELKMARKLLNLHKGIESEIYNRLDQKLRELQREIISN